MTALRILDEGWTLRLSGMAWNSILEQMINDSAQVTLCYTAAMRRRGKLDLEKIRTSLNTPCPHCGHSISHGREHTWTLST